MGSKVRDAKARAIVRRRAKGICERCGGRIETDSHSAHHRFPQRNGGVDSVVNLLWLCLGCHRDIHRDEHYGSHKGWLAGEHPDLTPVWIHRKWWALLTPAGGYEPLDPLDALDMLAWLAGKGCERCA